MPELIPTGRTSLPDICEVEFGSRSPNSGRVVLANETTLERSIGGDCAPAASPATLFSVDAKGQSYHQGPTRRAPMQRPRIAAVVSVLSSAQHHGLCLARTFGSNHFQFLDQRLRQSLSKLVSSHGPNIVWGTETSAS